MYFILIWCCHSILLLCWDEFWSNVFCFCRYFKRILKLLLFVVIMQLGISWPIIIEDTEMSNSQTFFLFLNMFLKLQSNSSLKPDTLSPVEAKLIAWNFLSLFFGNENSVKYLKLSNSYKWVRQYIECYHTLSISFTIKINPSGLNMNKNVTQPPICFQHYLRLEIYLWNLILLGLSYRRGA